MKKRKYLMMLEHSREELDLWLAVFAEVELWKFYIYYAMLAHDVENEIQTLLANKPHKKKGH